MEQTPPVKITKALIYKDYLANQGYRPEIDGDGDVIFKREGRTFIIFANEDDEEYFRLAYPNFWKLETEEEKSRAVIVCDRINATRKVIKVFTVKDNVWAGAELFFSDVRNFMPVFERLCRAIVISVNSFSEKMKEK